jgi:surface polysaccharide O-acyltransferase-like enzyme
MHALPILVAAPSGSSTLSLPQATYYMLNLSPTLPPVVTQASLSSSRNSTIDIIRTVACFGVIAIHVHSSTPAAENLGLFFLNFCVPFFFATALAYFGSSLKPTINIKDIISKISKRIEIPFLAWSFIYASLLFAKSILSGKPYSLDLIRLFLYGESAEHMYYLPELLVMQLLTLGIYLLTIRTKILTGFILAICSTSYLAWGYWHNYFGVTPAKCVLVYVATSFLFASAIKSLARNWSLLLIGIILFALPLLTNSLKAATIPFLNEYLFSLPLSGVGLLLIALNLPDISVPAWAKGITSATYGIYLSHVMFLEAFEFASEKAHISIKYTLTNKLLIASIIFLICIIFITVVRRIPKLRPLLLGEN